MNAFDQSPYRGPGIAGVMVGWLFMLIAILMFLRVAINLLMPLLPWIGGLLLFGLAVRWYMNRMWY